MPPAPAFAEAAAAALALAVAGLDAALLAAGLALGAAGPAGPPHATRSTAASAGLTLVRMGPPSVDLNYQLPYVVAKAKGFFQAEGIDVQMNLVAGNIAVPALLKGEIELTNHGAAMQATMQGAGSMKSVYFP